jgi:hypothetical protein
VVAADAGPMGIEWMGEAVWRWAGSAHRSTTDGMRRGEVVGVASLLTVVDREEREEAIDGARRRGRTPSAETPKTFVMSIVVSCGNRDRQRWRAELNFDRRESLDDSHRPRTLRAKPKIARTDGADLWFGL